MNGSLPELVYPDFGVWKCCPPHTAWVRFAEEAMKMMFGKGGGKRGHKKQGPKGGRKG
jgi:hypothetical protein